MTWPLWWWIAPAVLVFWTIGAHNRLVRLRAAVLQAFAALDGHMQRWIALAATAGEAQQAAAADTSDAADAAPGEAAPYSAASSPSATGGLHAAALQLQASLSAARAHPLDRHDIAALAAARDVLRNAWRRLPADAADATTPDAIRGAAVPLLWDQQDTQVQLACEQFNQAVLRYNAALSQFPAAVLAWVLRLAPARTL